MSSYAENVYIRSGRDGQTYIRMGAAGHPDIRNNIRVFEGSAASRRIERKIAARKRKRKVLIAKRFCITVISLSIATVALYYTKINTSIWSHITTWRNSTSWNGAPTWNDSTTWSDEAWSSDMLEDSELSKDIERLTSEGYPQGLIDLYIKNPEARDFVNNYKANVGTHHDIDISSDVVAGEIPLFLQWDERWGYETYGNDMIALNGCGPTALSMVYTGLTGNTDMNPYQMALTAQSEAYYVPGIGTSWDMMTDLAANLGLNAFDVPHDAESIKDVLSQGSPIICIMGPGDFTTTGHFIVLTGIDENGNVTLNDPNSKEKSSQTWDIETLLPQIQGSWGYTY